MFKRGSGILIHITSLPSSEWLGNLGPGAYAFVDFLAEAGQTYWQVLPLNPPSPGEGNSPYSSASAFAGNVYLISPELLASEGLIPGEMAAGNGVIPKDRVDFKNALEYKDKVLNEAYETFRSRGDWGDYDRFCSENPYWLGDYALFVALKKHLDGGSWGDWPEDIRERTPGALDYYGRELAPEIERQKFFQYLFYQQWLGLKKYANGRGIEIFGDIPDIYELPERRCLGASGDIQAR